MFRIALVNMPFGALHTPSLGLTQLKGVLKRELGDQVRTDVYYLNHDFATFFGVELYRYLSDDSRTTVTGFTDWLFRPLAFPDAPDTSAQYLTRYKHSLSCRCEDGRRREMDGCASSPSSCVTEPNSVPCCLDPDVLGQMLRKQGALQGFMDELVESYGLKSYDVVGFTSMFDQTAASIAMARRVKASNPFAVTIMGGASCETGVGSVLARRVDAIDFIFAGPALRSLPEFVRNLIAGERERCHAIQGVYSRAGLEQRRSSGSGGLGHEEDINHRVSLDYDDFLGSLETHRLQVEPELFFETSRGCWWGERSHCTFCGINGEIMHFRSMSPDNVRYQFGELFARYPHIRRFTAVDNILEPTYLSTVFPFVKAPEGASIFYETRVLTNVEDLQLLAEAGVTKIQPGIEALSTNALKLMKKGTTAFQNLTLLKRLDRYGIEADWNLLTGFPNEDASVYEQYIKMIPRLVHLPAPVATFPVRFDRHSPHYRNPAAFGLDLRPVDFYALIYPFAAEELSDFAYYWADHNLSNAYLFNLARWQRKIESAVDGWRTRWYGRDGGLRPELRLTDKGGAVYDSRSGVAQNHYVSDLGLSLLSLLEQPMNRLDLQKRLGTRADETDRELDLLNDHGMLFEEGDRFLSLLTSGAYRVENIRLRATTGSSADLVQIAL